MTRLPRVALHEGREVDVRENGRGTVYALMVEHQGKMTQVEMNALEAIERLSPDVPASRAAVVKQLIEMEAEPRAFVWTRVWFSTATNPLHSDSPAAIRIRDLMAKGWGSAPARPAWVPRRRDAPLYLEEDRELELLGETWWYPPMQGKHLDEALDERDLLERQALTGKRTRAALQVTTVRGSHRAKEAPGGR